MASPGTQTAKSLDDENFAGRKLEWAGNHSLDIAAELVGSGIVLGRTTDHDVEAAARLILDEYSDASSPLREIASFALGKRTTPQIRLFGAPKRGRLDRARIYHQISLLRQSLHRQPRNVLSWLDLARLYATLGQTRQAERNITIALYLSPNDRFTLRCCARFFVHMGDPQRALHLLQRSSSIKSDPWLMAAEIAVAQVLNRPSKMLSRANAALSRGHWSPHSQSELQGSVATALLYDGATTKARRLFQQSLLAPTENVVAQAQWASSHASGLVIPHSALAVPDNFEAKAIRGRDLGNWDHVIKDCWDWADYEPTSTRPMIMGSYTAAVVFGDAMSALEFAQRGAIADPNSMLIRNNEIVALAMMGRVDDAWEKFQTISMERETAANRSVLLATFGLLSFRSGDVEQGRWAYEKAITALRADPQLNALALWHLAQEEIVAKTSERGAALARAELASKNVLWPELPRLSARIRKMA